MKSYREKENSKYKDIFPDRSINYKKQHVILDEEGDVIVNNEDETLTFARMEDLNKKEPSYIMTIELERGKSDIIQIYLDSSPDEVAFEFCKKNNLNLKAMQFLSSEIDRLLAKITIQCKKIK